LNIKQDINLDYEYFTNVLEDSDGNLILSGSGLTNSLGWGDRAFLSKFSSNGILDTSFGENGFYCFDFGGGSYKPIFQIGNQYITAGSQIVSVNHDGTSASDLYTCGIYYFQDMKIQGKNKLILGGGSRIDDSNNTNFALERVILDLETSIKLIDDSSSNPVIFPNPVKETLYFSHEATFEIIDAQGRILLKSATPIMSVNVGSLQSGIYFIRFGTIVQKFIKI
ncbi:MAG: T9SS type A sorting domain-containing protein, partial [Tannerella sp.]|jgi:hypothetical protein|nr:T9SS type A sorting domain-containing protein [Tannerella sp.]